MKQQVLPLVWMGRAVKSAWARGLARVRGEGEAIDSAK